MHYCFACMSWSNSKKNMIVSLHFMTLWTFLVMFLKNLHAKDIPYVAFILGVIRRVGSLLRVPRIMHYSDVIMSSMVSQITSLTIVCSTVYSGADQTKHQSSTSLAFVRGTHRWPLNSPHKGPVTRKMFSFDDVIMVCLALICHYRAAYRWRSARPHYFKWVSNGDTTVLR